MKKLLKILIGYFGYVVMKKNSHLNVSVWAGDSEFNLCANKIRPYTLLGHDRLFNLWQYVKLASKLDGSMAQVGVYRGGSAFLISNARLYDSTPFYLFDTFEGMPDVDINIDLHKKGDFSNTTLSSVQKLFTNTKNVIFYKGLFPGTAESIVNKKFSFVYIDVDIYKSVKDSINFFYPRMVQGGCIIFDDYNGKNTPGVKKAIDEYLIDKREKCIITAIGQCVLTKIDV